MAEKLRLHHFLPTSRANGPGLRAVIWVQGCTLACPGCFNPDTHSAKRGSIFSVDDLLGEILALRNTIEGVTFSGGEPFQQIKPVLNLLKRIRAETSLSILVFSGYTWQEIESFPLVSELATCIDVLISGRYDATQPLTTGLVSSANQVPIFFSNRYTKADLLAVPPAEVILAPDGELLVSGVGGIKASSFLDC